MLEIKIKSKELYDEIKNEFIDVPNTVLRLEHSLDSVRQWESKYSKAFLSSIADATINEFLWYIYYMTLNKDDIQTMYVYKCISSEDIAKVLEYINKPMTATRISSNPTELNIQHIKTAEEIYCDMIMLNIPTEYQYWHLNQLMTLIKVCSIKSQPPKKMSRNDELKQRSQLNEMRKKMYNTTG